MKTICVMRDVFKAMARFEDAFEKVYQVSLNEAMILCALQEASPNNMTATSLSKRTEADTLSRFKDAPDSGRKRTDCQNTRRRGPETDAVPSQPER